MAKLDEMPTVLRDFMDAARTAGDDSDDALFAFLEEEDVRIQTSFHKEISLSDGWIDITCCEERGSVYPSSARYIKYAPAADGTIEDYVLTYKETEALWDTLQLGDHDDSDYVAY